MTPQQIEALKLALEALEGFYEYGYDRQECFEHITAIKEALLEHAMQEVQRLGQEIEQEPLEYWNAVEGWVKIAEVREHFGAVGCGTIYKTAGEDRVPVYTHPPQRTWVGLTDEDKCRPDLGKWVEISDEWMDGYTAGLEYGETKLKEKNT